jgi:L-lysine 6-transaminase
MLHVEEHFPKLVSNVRGMGLIAAFDLPDTATRNAVIQHGLQHNVLFLGAGPRSIRFRPSLTITQAEINQGMDVLEKVLREMV